MIKCETLLEKVSYTYVQGPQNPDIDEVVHDSRKIRPGCMFVCIKGANADGHLFVEEAIEKGAVCIVTQQELPDYAQASVTIIRVADTKSAMAHIAAAYYGYPADTLKVIGITGTKGKTTTSYMVKSILEHAGHKVGLVGTIEVVIGKQHIPSGNTTPEPLLLHEYFAQMLKAGCDMAVMEVSSQGLKLHRTHGITFDCGIFTNIKPDHIGPGEHDDFEEYMACKGRLFRQCTLGIVNCDDENQKNVTAGHTCELVTYGFHQNAEYRATDVRLLRDKDRMGVTFSLTGRKELEVMLPTPGKFSVYNALTAIAVCDRYKVNDKDILEGLARIFVKGRLEPVKYKDGIAVLIDYAHNAMALESLLLTLKEYRPKRLICLFGCGGNRARLRRYEMGEVSGRLADVTVITSDNPRFENPQDIIQDIVTGIKRTDGQYITIENRKDAIAYTLKNAREGDLIVLAGKGHEQYQEIQGIRYPLDERELIQR